MENNTQLSSSPAYGEVTSTRKLTKACIYLSLVYILLCVPADIYSAFLPITGEISNAESFSLSVSLLLLPINILFLIWTYKTNKNSHASGATGMTFSPGWACFLSMIPIVDYFVLQELWKTSINPLNWRNERGSSRIMWSLIASICSMIILPIYIFVDTLALLGAEGLLNDSMMRHVSIMSPYITVLSIIFTLTWVVWALLTLSVMPRISASQETSMLKQQA